MRLLDIPPFPKRIEFTDLDHLVRTRLNQTTVVWPLQAIPLVAYMAHPNDPDARASLVTILNGWFSGSPVVPHRIRQMQLEWLRVGDIFNVHHDIRAGGHQLRRGGASIGKAIAVVAASTVGWGASEANLWSIWKRYKDVAPLAAAAGIVAAEARQRFKVNAFGGFGFTWDQLLPMPVAMMLPDLVLSLALYFQEYGLAQVPHSKDKPMLDPETLWRIPSDINVVPIPAPIRKIDSNGRATLHARRAGNRGR